MRGFEIFDLATTENPSHSPFQRETCIPATARNRISANPLGSSGHHHRNLPDLRLPGLWPALVHRIARRVHATVTGMSLTSNS